MFLRSRIIALAFAIAVVQIFCAVQAAAGDRDPFESAPAGDGQTISADFGPNPLTPARSDSGSSTATSSWGATSDPVEMLPLAAETAPFITAHDIPRAGYPHGVERPPKSSL